MDLFESGYIWKIVCDDGETFYFIPKSPGVLKRLNQEEYWFIIRNNHNPNISGFLIFINKDETPELNSKRLFQFSNCSQLVGEEHQCVCEDMFGGVTGDRP